MKNTYLILLLLITFSCCKKDDDPINPIDQLPPATQTGANTVGCLVNGEVFLPQQEGINPAVVCNYEFINGDFFFSLTFSDLIGTGIKSVNIRTQRIELEDNLTYSLDKNFDEDGDYSGGGGTYGINASNYFYTNSINAGELNIMRIDLANSIISGTFWFDAINTEGDIVEIREGRFDYTY